MKKISSPLMFLLGVSTFGILMFGCAPAIQENAFLEQSRAAFAEAQADPKVQKNAPVELQQAKTNLDQADRLLKEGAEAQQVEHFAYLAKQQTAIAQEIANVKLAEQALDAASEERNKILLIARTQEAAKATKLAEAQKMEAERSAEEANAARLKAEDARLKAEAMSAEARKAKLEVLAAAEQAKLEALAAAEQARLLEAQISELQAKKSKRGLVITLGDVLFDTNKSELRSGAQYTIDKLAAFLSEYPERKVMIEGFTDNTGAVEYNQQLSERRAGAVQEVLEAKGIDSSRILTRGYGVEFPVANNDTAEGRQRNRRVEVIIADDDGRIQERK
ncbi:MAG: OmpA family protein [Desulfuromonadaceae bacterium]|nr:OmpA family protein [Desulfuromonadaceae bacterium]